MKPMVRVSARTVRIPDNPPIAKPELATSEVFKTWRRDTKFIARLPRICGDTPPALQREARRGFLRIFKVRATDQAGICGDSAPGGPTHGQVLSRFPR